MKRLLMIWCEYRKPCIRSILSVGIALGGVVLSGCFSLKTPLPQISYYDLDSSTHSQSDCKPSSRIGIAEIQVPSMYEGRDFLFKQSDGRIINIEGIVWIDAPKNLIKKFLVKELNASCLQTSLPPFGGIKNDFLLKLELLNFEIIQSSAGQFAQISIFYELSNSENFKVVQSGVISRKLEVNGDYVRAFREAMKGVNDELVEELKSQVQVQK